MGVFTRSWRLSKASWRLLRQDRELLLLPVLSLICVIGLVAVGGALAGTLGVFNDGAGGVALLLLFVWAIATAAVGVFFEGALVAGAYDRMNGGDPTVSSAMRAASGRLPAMIGWAAITVSVGVLIRALQERFSWLGSVLGFLADMAWHVATYLVVPAIVVDNSGPVDGIKRSGSLVRSTWGENLVSSVGFSILGAVLCVPFLAVGFLILALAPSGIGAIIGGTIAIGGVLGSMVVVSALIAYFKTALYVYATQQRVPEGFDDDQMQQMFSTR